eukprot:3682177-Prymnesium_polylepis.1
MGGGKGCLGRHHPSVELQRRRLDLLCHCGNEQGLAARAGSRRDASGAGYVAGGQLQPSGEQCGGKPSQ